VAASVAVEKAAAEMSANVTAEALVLEAAAMQQVAVQTAVSVETAAVKPPKKAKAREVPSRFSTRAAVTSKRKAAPSPEILRAVSDFGPHHDLDLSINLDRDISFELEWDPEKLEATVPAAPKLDLVKLSSR